MTLTTLRATAALGVCTALLAAGCGASAAPAGPAPAAGAAPAAVAAPPSGAPAGPEPAYATALRPQLEALAREMLVTGSVITVRTPQGDWTMTYGSRTYGAADPVSPTDHVRVGSNTKPMTGTVILQLVAEGRLGLDDPIARYRPEVPNGGAITIRQLLEMRSGLYNYTEALELNQAQDADPGRVYRPEELLAMGFARPPLYPPGQGFNYSNTNIVLLGLVIEQLSGRSASEEFRDRLFTPLGMSGTSLPLPADATIPAPFAHGYTYGTNVETIESSVLPDDVQARARSGQLAPTDVTAANPSWGWTAGSAISTVDDLVRFVRALAGGGLLPPELQAQRLESVRPVDPADTAATSGYGMGLARYGPLYGHTGELPGYNSFMGHDPGRDITVVVWATDAPTVDGRAPATELAKVVIGELYAA
ncbi:serine hydrolase domain-containing protein [Actinomycetospora straminea]|uniref:Serine hydrolase domain-containing protein n=1 Tax=Actinomycetospora straminea TaxID=663607 RepID=A0ABP9E3E1_9PSEU|nr:serine hydrolase domain-containing protein [Actinomycetospora straminea]MDD7934590.1 serine hydrolase [Actinomycetospora straminea]